MWHESKHAGDSTAESVVIHAPGRFAGQAESISDPLLLQLTRAMLEWHLGFLKQAQQRLPAVVLKTINNELLVRVQVLFADMENCVSSMAELDCS